MTINPEKISDSIESPVYEQPSLKKYGTMKELTLDSGGSGADALGKADPDDNAGTMANPDGPGGDDSSDLVDTGANS